jgi:hypothetical protein
MNEAGKEAKFQDISRILGMEKERIEEALTMATGSIPTLSWQDWDRLTIAVLSWEKGWEAARKEREAENQPRLP